MSSPHTRGPASNRLRLACACLALASFCGYSNGAELPSISADADASVETRPVDIRYDPRVEAWWQVLGWGLTLLVAFLFAAIAIVVFSRRFLGLITPGKRTPTPVEDVWAMQQPPPEADREDS